jgi:hypothetical protein
MRPLGPLIALSLASMAGADDVYLVGGGKVTGEIVERTAQRVVVETGPGRVTLPMARVTRIETGRSTLAEFRERARTLKPADVEGWVALGRWADERDLGTQASEAYAKALAADPGNAEANRAFGRTEVGGRWLTREESYREQGLVPFEGSWVTPAERDTALKERSAADLADRDAREAEARVREAEARARAAEAEARRAEAGAQPTEDVGIPYWPYVYPGGGVFLPPQPACCQPVAPPTPEPTPGPKAPAPGPTSINGADTKPDDAPRPQPPPAKAVPRPERKR